MSALKIVIKGSTLLCSNGAKSLGIASKQAVWNKFILSGQTSARCLATNVDVDKKVKDVKESKIPKETKMPEPDHLEHFKPGRVDDMPEPDSLQHFKKPKESSSSAIITKTPPPGVITLPHPIWEEQQVHEVKITHTPPETIIDKMAYYNVQMLRKVFDIFSGFSFGYRNERKWLNRISFLETVAGVPGMVAAMLRHMKSLRRLQRDFGWIHTLLEEAENERMHLLTVLELKQPSMLFKLSVIASQGVFVTWFSFCYMLSPRFCHRFVGYLEEEAVKTYSKCLEDIENGSLQHWQTQRAPDVALRYWKLKEDATMKDVILAIRADEAHHRVVNHTLASMKPTQFNPYKPGQ
ncbi:alternative oxidase, mitochondrial-like [Gigantopelta aegis]|uniref:alternative oxidase, mitochondrial-like n=1 Tax=Gigantopelta aegis TaxID=1735272 RepID=UPI001B88CF58|nr:alternative oxidase, mitochondrial-like [Gigantopelta aegis]